MTGVFFLLFPLSVAGAGIGVHQNTHEWILTLLEKIGKTMGVQQALAMIPVLKLARAKNTEVFGCHVDGSEAGNVEISCQASQEGQDL